MSPREEEEFELVLGNRQLFFLAVVLFGVFFSIGYTVGYGRGAESADAVAAATKDPAPKNEAAAVLPTTHADVEKRSPAEPAAGGTKPESTASERAAAPDSRSVKPSLQPQTISPDPAAIARNTAVTPSTPAPSTPTSSSSKTAPDKAAGPSAAKASASSSRSAVRRSPAEPSRSVPTPTLAVPEIVPGSIYLQVAASTEATPARELLLKYKSMGHAVALDNNDPAWFRILVGPFPTMEAAAEYQVKLKADRIDSFIRKF